MVSIQGLGWLLKGTSVEHHAHASGLQCRGDSQSSLTAPPPCRKVSPIRALRGSK
jgi:hypothetical protein